VGHAGGRAPTVGALGDAGAVAERHPPNLLRKKVHDAIAYAPYVILYSLCGVRGYVSASYGPYKLDKYYSDPNYFDPNYFDPNYF